MKKALISLIAFILASCSSIKKDHDHEKTPEEILPIIRIFERDFRLKVTVPVKFDYLDPHLAGVCIFYNDGFREVKINKLTWNELNQVQKEILVYHELVHCELRINHTPNITYETGCPISIMKPAIFTSYQAIDCFKRNRDFYLSEINMHRLFK